MKRMMPVIGFVGDIVQIYRFKRVSRSAAEFAYFLTLSIFPLLIIAVVILASFDMSLDELLSDVWAGDILSAAQNYLNHVSSSHSRQMLVGALVIIATASSAAFRAVSKIMTDIQGHPRYRGVFNFVVSFLFSLLLVFTIYLSVFMIATGGWLMQEVEALTGIQGLATVWQWLRFVLLFVVGVVVVHLMYLFTAPREPKIRRLPGAVLGTVALVVASMIFSLFIGASARYPLVYGSLASFIILMVWCYLCGNILILGNVVNYTLHKRKLHSFAHQDNSSNG